MSANPPPVSVITGMQRGTYDGLGRVNWSSLKHIAKSPAHYRQNLLTPDEDTPARKLGRCIHLAALEPELFRSMCAVWHGGRRQGKEWDAFKADNAGRELLTEDEHAQCVAVQRAVRADPLASPLLSSGSAEVSVLWANEETGLECKGRLDYVSAAAIVDLKSGRSVGGEDFCAASWRMKYHVQAAFYLDGYEAATGNRPPYYIVAVESDAPHVVQVYRVPEMMLAMGREEYVGMLATLARCRKTDDWGGYSNVILELAPPRWVSGFSEDEDMSETGIIFSQEVAP